MSVASSSRGSNAAINAMQTLLRDVRSDVKKLPLGDTLYDQRKLAVYRGNPEAQILVIGEAPGEEESKRGRPFVGPSGQLFDAMFEAVTGKDSNSHAFVTNCIFIQPPKNRDPTGFELQSYEPYVRRMICELPNLKVVICLGRYSSTLAKYGFDTAKAFCKPEGKRVTVNEAVPKKLFNLRQEEGNQQRIVVTSGQRRKDLWMVPMTHPSALLRGKEVSKEFDPKRSAFTNRMQCWIERLRLALTTLETRVQKSMEEMRKFVFSTVEKAKELVNNDLKTQIEAILGEGMGASFETFWRRRLRPFIRTLIEQLKEVAQPQEGRQHTEASLKALSRKRDELSTLLSRIETTIGARLQREVHNVFSSRRPFNLKDMNLEEREDGAHDPTNQRYLTAAASSTAIRTNPEMVPCLRLVSRTLPDPSKERIALLQDLEYDRTNNLMRMYMETPQRESMMIAVSNLNFWLYVEPHPAFNPTDPTCRVDKDYGDRLAKMLHWRLAEAMRRNDQRLVTHHKYILKSKVECELAEDYRVLNEGYVPKGRTFLRLIVNHHDLIEDIHRELYNIVSEYYKADPNIPKRRLMVCNHFNAETQFSYNYEMRLSHWLRFKPNALRYFQPAHEYGTQIYATCQDWSKVECMELSEKIPFNDGSGLNSGSHAPCSLLAMDIECANPEFHFPNPYLDPVVTISMTVQLRSENTTYDGKNAYIPDEASGYWRLSFQMGPCNKTNMRRREIIHEFADERELLDAWAEAMLMIDPSYVAGHNIKSFDLNYIIDRMQVINTRIKSLGQNRDECVRVDIRKFVSRAYGERKIVELRGMRGWIIIDTLEVYLREKKLPSYTLNFICKKFLGDQKDDVPYSALWGLLCGTDEDRRRIVDYCLRDAQLVDQLVNIHAWIVNMVEFARVNGTVQENRLYISGQQEKVCAAAQHCNTKLNRRILFYTPNYQEKQFNNDVAINSWLLGNEGCDEEKKTWEEVAEVNAEDIEMADAEAGVSEISEELKALELEKREETKRKREEAAAKRGQVMDLASWIRVRNRVDAVVEQLDQAQFFSEPREGTDDDEDAPTDDTGHLHALGDHYDSPDKSATMEDDYPFVNPGYEQMGSAAASSSSTTTSSSSSVVMDDDDDSYDTEYENEERPECENEERPEISDELLTQMVENARSKVTVGMALRMPISEDQIDDEVRPHVKDPIAPSRQQKRKMTRDMSKKKIRYVEYGQWLVGKQVPMPDGSLYTVTEEDMEVATMPMEEVVRKCEERRKETARLLSSKSANEKPKSVREMILDKIKHLEMLMDMQKETSILSRLESAYQGATVMPPKPGFHYLLPVICVDFAALYPSIMMAYNISPDTKLFESDFERFGGVVTRDMCWKAPGLKGRNMLTGRRECYYFIKKEHYEGLFPLMEVNLLAARKIAKREMAYYDESIQDENGNWIPNPNYDPVKRAVFDGRQLQIKIVCNSGYGAMGADGLVGDKDCAAAVTAWGRIAIELVRDILIERYNAECVGGDTDSVFMVFPGFAPGTVLKEGQRNVRIETVEQAEAFSGELETFINSHFRAPMKIEYEKAMFPMIISGKKRYCGIIHEKGKKGRFFSKGMETVRRDSLPVTKEAMMKVFNTILVVRKASESLEDYEREVKRRKLDCIKIVQDACIKLLKGDVTVSDLVMSKQLSRAEYASRNQAHLTVADKMAERGEDPPKLGERVPFIFVILPDAEGKPGTSRKGYEKAEHPDYAVRNGMHIDYAHYVDKKMVKPVLRVMKHIIRDLAITNIVKRHRKTTMVREEYSENGETKTRTVLKNVRTITESQITPAMIEEEVEQILFETAPKGSRERRNVQTKYMRRHPEMRNRVIYKPKLRREYSALADHVQTSNHSSRIDDLRRKHNLDTGKSEEEDKLILTQGLEKERGALKEAQEYAAQCLRTCQQCVKQERVLCNAYDCTSYFPRVASKGAADDLEEQVLQLEVDIENLHLLPPPPAPAVASSSSSPSEVKIHKTTKRKTPTQKKTPESKRKRQNQGLRPISSFFQNVQSATTTTPSFDPVDTEALMNGVVEAIRTRNTKELSRLLDSTLSLSDADQDRLYENWMERVQEVCAELYDNRARAEGPARRKNFDAIFGLLGHHSNQVPRLHNVELVMRQNDAEDLLRNVEAAMNVGKLVKLNRLLANTKRWTTEQTAAIHQTWFMRVRTLLVTLRDMFPDIETANNDYIYKRMRSALQNHLYFTFGDDTPLDQ